MTQSAPSAADGNPQPAASTPPPPPPPPAKAKRRWKRRLVIFFITVLVLAIAARVTVIVALPSVLRKVAATYDLDASFERTEMYLLAGDVGIWHLTLRPKGGGDAILDSEYCRADVSAINLLRGRLVVRRLEADGLDLRAERDADGTIPLLARFIQGKPAQSTSSTPTEIPLEAPLQIDALRVSRVRARWIDRAVSPPVDTQLELTMRLSDFGSAVRPARFSLDMVSPPLLDQLRVEGEGTTSNGTIDAHLEAVARGIHPKPAAGYLWLIGVRPVADDIVLRSSMKVKLQRIAQATPQDARPATRPAELKGVLKIENSAILADNRESAGVDQIIIDVDTLGARSIDLRSVTVDGVRGGAHRTAEGKLRVAGLELGAPAPPSSAAAPAPTAPSTTAPSMAPLSITLAKLDVKNVRLSLQDESVTPAANLGLLVRDLTVKDIVADPTRQQVPVAIEAHLSAPGVAEAIDVSGSATPFAMVKTLDAKVAASGIRPDALRGYLDALGLESEFKQGSATCALQASVSIANGAIGGEARVTNVKLDDQGNELVALDGVRIAGLHVDPAASSYRVESIDITGPRTAARRDAGGVLRAFGLRTKSSPATPAPAAAAVTASPATQPAVASAAAPASPPLKLLVGRLTWHGAAVRLEDAAVSPPASVTINDAGVELSDVNIDLSPDAKATTPGKLHAWLKCPGIADALEAAGTITPTPQAVAADLDVKGSGLRGALLAAYLKPLGVEPTLRDGSLQLKTRATITRKSDGIVGASIAIKDVRYADGQQELVGADAVSIDNVAMKPNELSVASIQLDKPRARAERDADGSLLVAGLRIAPPATQPATQPAAGATVAAATTQPATTPPAPTVGAAPAMALVLNKLRVNEGSLAIVDRAVQPPVEAVGRATVELDQFVFGRDADAARLKLVLALDKTIDSFTVAGTVSPSLDRPSATLDIAGSGIRQGVIAPYLPPGVRVALKDGRVRAKLQASAAPNAKGGRSASLVVSDVDYRDGNQEQSPSLFRFDSAKVAIARADLPGRVIAIDEISLAGLQTGAVKTADGQTELLGLRLAPPTATQPAARQPAAEVAIAAPATPATQPTTAPTDVATLMAQTRQKLPLVTLEKLDLRVRRASFTDRSRPDAAPIALADVSVRNLKRIEMLGDDATAAPPAEIQITGKVDPVVDQFDVGIKAAPFASQPTLEIAIAAKGIRGDGATALVPELREKIDGAALTDGRFTARFETQAKIDRRGPTEFDFSKPFELTALLRGVEFRAAPDTPVLAGVEEMRAEPVRVDPVTGSVTVRTLEITKPIGKVYRDADGVHALGLLVKLPATQPSATQPAPQPAPQETTPAPAVVVASASTQPAQPAQPTQATPPTARPEYRIDKLVISGVDFRAEDRTTDPPLIVPLDSLEVEVRDLSSLALVENRPPIRFNVTAGGGKVPLGGGDSNQRELFSEVAAAGAVSLYPQPRGWARSSVSGLELLALRGPAAAQKVQIGGGVFDSSVDMRMSDDGTLNTRSRFAFTDLKMSEPSDGIIRRTLKLPAPLDAMIVTLQDASGAITLPLSVDVKSSGKVDGGQVAGAAVGALASVFATAVASTPLKVTGGVTQLVGLDLGGKKKHATTEPAAAIAFAAGVADPGSEGAALERVIERLRKDKTLEVTLRHDFGAGDIPRVATRANPMPAECLALAQSLRRHKAQLLAARAPLASQARAILASEHIGPAAAAAPALVTADQVAGGDDELSSLRALDRDLAATEDALDRLTEMLRPGAERQADRRTRAAALELADDRLATVRAQLIASGLPNADARVKITHPSFPAAPPATRGSGDVADTGDTGHTGAAGSDGGRVSLVVLSKKK